jgi:tetratricopeptide (TPR) repeat protein
MQTFPDADPIEVATTMNNLATCSTAQKRYSEAEPLFQKALAERERLLGKNHRDVAETLRAYSALLTATGRSQQAAEFEERAKAIRAASP